MTRSEYNHFIKGLYADAIALSDTKSKDYATNDDVLSNFKRMATLCSTLLKKDIKPWEMAQILQMLKQDRLANLLATNQCPANEPITDTMLDELNYLLLKYALIKKLKKPRKINDVIPQVSMPSDKCRMMLLKNLFTPNRGYRLLKKAITKRHRGGKK